MENLKNKVSFMENRAYFSNYPYSINSSCVKEFIKALKTLKKEEFLYLNEYYDALKNKSNKKDEFDNIFGVGKFEDAVNSIVYQNKSMEEVSTEIFNDDLGVIQKSILQNFCNITSRGEEVCEKVLNAIDDINLKKIEIENKRIESNKKKLQMNIARLAKTLDGKELEDAVIALNNDFELEEKKRELETQFNFKFGSAVHSMCLEGISLNDALVEHFDIGISEEQKELLLSVVDRYNQCKLSFEDMIIEGVFFKDYLDLELKAKMDLVCKIDGKICIVDLKTISQINRVHNNIDEYAYWFQLLYYKYILESEDVKIDDLILIFVSKKTEIKALDDEISILKFSELSKKEMEKQLFQFDDAMRLFKMVRDFAYGKPNLSSYLKSKFCI